MTNNSGMRLLIKEAFKAYRKKRFSEAIALLEKIISYGPAEIQPYFLLCVSYLMQNRFSEADIMIKRCRSIDPDYRPLNQLEAFLSLKSAPDIHSAITVYIDKLNSYPRDKYFKNALRNLHNENNFGLFQKKAKLKDFVFIPKPKINSKHYKYFYRNQQRNKKIQKKTSAYRFNYGKFIFLMLIICLAAGAGIVYHNYFDTIKELLFKTENTKPNLPIDSIDISLLQYELIDKIQKTKPNVFYYNNNEVINDFNKAKALIKNEKNNDALMLINKISNSNANYRVKEKIEFLRKFIAGIEYRNYIAIPVEHVFQKSYLYMGTSVKWKGKITNLRRKDKSFTFNLLIDYKKDDIFKGIIDVYCGKDYKDINNGDIVSIEGILINTSGAGNRLYLSADNIVK